MIEQNHQNSVREIVCIVCPNGCRIQCEAKDGKMQCNGQKCLRGKEYAIAEMTHPMRSLTTSVKTVFPDTPVVSVRTSGEIEKSKLIDVAKALGQIIVDQRIKIGDIVAENICNTGINVICTSDRLVHPY